MARMLALCLPGFPPRRCAPKSRELVLGPPLWSRACPGRVKR